jgi:PAS domain S-box-containing protein
MSPREPIRYGRIWTNLPLRLKAAVCYLAPLPLIALIVLSLNFFGFHKFQVLALPTIVIELLAGVWMLETILRRIQDLKTATDRLQEGETTVEIQPHSWEINGVGWNLKTLAAALREQQDLVKACRAEVSRLFDDAPVAYLETDGEGKVMRANRAVCDLLGKTREELCGKPSWELLPGTSAEASQERVLAKLVGRHVAAESFEQLHQRSDESRLLAAVHESPLRDAAGRAIGLRYTLVDITVKLAAAETMAQYQETLRQKDEEVAKALAAAAEAGETRTRFLSGVSNDLRVPLNGIVGFAELMFDGKIGVVSADQRECLGDILTSARHLGTLVDQLIDSARTEPGRRPEVRRETIDLEALIYDARYVIQVLTAQRRGIRIDLELDPDIREVAADPVRLKQVLTNYLSYSMRMAPEGGRVLMRSVLEGANSFRLEVEFNRAGTEDGPVLASPEGEAELAQARQLVEEQGGQAGMRNHGPRGTLLYAVLPSFAGAAVKKPDLQVLGAGPEPSPAREQSVTAIEQLRQSLDTLGVVPDRRRAVLVVGQRVDAVQALIGVLENLGYMPFWLRDLKFTLQIAAQEQPSAVIVDLQHEGLANFEFVRRALRSVGMSTPVLGFPGNEITSPDGEGRRTQEAPPPKEATPRPRLTPLAGGGQKRTA